MRKLSLIIALALLVTTAFAQMVFASGDLIVYSNWSRDHMQQLKAAFEKENPDINMQFFRAAGAELYTTFLTEMQNNYVRADYIFSDLDYMKDYVKAGYIYQYKPAGATKMDPEFVDKDGYWIPIDNSPYVMVYNTKYVDAKDAPKAWKDLLDPRWKNRIGMCDPRTSAGVQVPIQFITKYLKEEQGEPYGWDFFAKIWDQNPILTSGHRREMDLVISGEIWVAAEMPLGFITEHYGKEPIEIVFPEEGSPASPNTAAVVKGAPHLENAIKLHEFLASKKGQTFLSEVWGAVPAHQEVDFAAPDGTKLSEIIHRKISIPLDARKANTEKFYEVKDQ